MLKVDNIMNSVIFVNPGLSYRLMHTRATELWKQIELKIILIVTYLDKHTRRKSLNVYTTCMKSHLKIMILYDDAYITSKRIS